jgi:hypothetical protein
MEQLEARIGKLEQDVLRLYNHVGAINKSLETMLEVQMQLLESLKNFATRVTHEMEPWKGEL